MRATFSGLIAAFWLIFWSVRILADYDRLMSYDNGRLLLVLYFLAVAMGVLFILYLVMREHAPKMLYSVNRSSRCPDCYAKLKGMSDFCPKCGKDLRERADSRICWNCGYEETDSKATSCPKCGREYKK